MQSIYTSAELLEVFAWPNLFVCDISWKTTVISFVKCSLGGEVKWDIQV